MKNFFSWQGFQDLIIGNILWIILVSLLLFFCFKLPQAFLLSIKLLKNNRPTIGKPRPKHKADILIHLWGLKGGFPKNKESDYYFSPAIQEGENAKRIKYKGVLKEFINDKIIRYDVNNEIYLPIKNVRNKILIWLLKDYLIRYTGDKKSHYKSL